MKRTPEQQAARRARQQYTATLNKCSCGNCASLGFDTCSACRSIMNKEGAMTNEIKPDGWCGFEDDVPYADCCFAYEEDTENRVRELNKLHKTETWTARPVCIVTPDEKSRIVSAELLEMLENFRKGMATTEAGQGRENAIDYISTMLDELNRIHPEKK